MSEAHFSIRRDGSADIISGNIGLKCISPSINETQVLPFSFSEREDSILYKTEQGSISLSFRKEDDEVILHTEAEGFEHVHDIEPIGAAVLSGAVKVYFQGFGMEGPSGYLPIDSQLRRSHGIVGLASEDSALAVFITDHRRYSAQFSVKREEKLFGDMDVFTAGINLEGTASGKIQLPEIHFLGGNDVEDCMRRAAVRIAEEMQARTSAEPGYHWCSWYYHYENMNQKTLDEFLEGLEKDRIDFRYIQLDAGYVDHIGDWNDINRRYPGGLKKAAETIRSAGYEPGIWIAPFMVGDQSELYRQHPDWVIHEKDGRPYVRFRSYTEPKIWGNTDNDYYVLDMTHPDAYVYLKKVFESYRSWGFTLYKTDFLLWGMQDSSEVVRYDNSKTSTEILRAMMAMIREAIGEESFLLGSIAPFMPCIGYTDGMRIASDMGAQWTAGAFGPSNLLQELPYDNYFNNVFWQNDPDAVILREFGTHLTEEETRSLALLQALSAENANPSNLVTGTHYLNYDGMRPLEEEVEHYIWNTGDHVLYMAKPWFAGDELVARGVQLTAMSLEDGGEGISFNVYCFNVTPNAEIDYRTGIVTSEEQAVQEARLYVINKRSKVFHYPTCEGAQSMSPYNREEVTATRVELTSQGYTPCGYCEP